MSNKKLAPAQEYVECAVDLLGGMTHRTAMKAYPALSDTDIRFVRKWVGMEPEQFTRAILEGMKATQAKLLALLFEKADQIPPGQLPLAVGILTDKVATMEGRPQSITASAVVHVDNREIARGEIASVLMGRAGRGHGNGRNLDHSDQVAGPAD